MTVMPDRIVVSVPNTPLDNSLEIRGSEHGRSRSIVVTPAHCVEPSTLDSFLRQLRQSSDDVVVAQLERAFRGQGADRSKQCDDYIQHELFPNWQARDKIISFCDAHLQQMRESANSKGLASEQPSSEKIDPRLDPYGARDQFRAKEIRDKDWRDLNDWITNGRQVERILRDNTVGQLRQNCCPETDYFDKFREWTNRH